MFLALLVDRGAKVSSIQHGGYMGMYESHPAVAIESCMVVDEYISSGSSRWGVREMDKYVNDPRPLPLPYLTSLKEKSLQLYSENKLKYSVTILVLTENRMLKWLYNPIFPDMAFDYFERERELFSYFNTISDVVVKTYKIDDGWGQYQWIKEKFPNIGCTCEGKFVDYALQSELVIVDYNSTGFAELLVMSVPFMATWSRRWFKGTPMFEECIDELQLAGIFFEDPHELVKVYNEVRDDVNSWWNDEKKFAVASVSERIALTASNVDQCKSVWNDEFKNE